MDLANWAFNTIDRIFSTMNLGKENPLVLVKPIQSDTSQTRGEALVSCRSDVKDVEDVHNWPFGTGVSSDWENLAVHGLLVQMDGLSRGMQAQNQYLLDLNHKLDAHAPDGG